jgi:hypothetical protein
MLTEPMFFCRSHQSWFCLLIVHCDPEEVRIIEGVGIHPGGGWPGEPSYLVLEIRRDLAIEIGQSYKQNAPFEMARPFDLPFFHHF